MAQHLSSYRVPALCEALQVSRSGFYRWKSVKHEVCAIDQAVSTAFAHHKARASAPVEFERPYNLNLETSAIH